MDLPPAKLGSPHDPSQIAVLAVACRQLVLAQPAAAAPRGRFTVLISIDGFSADYLDRGVTRDAFGARRRVTRQKSGMAAR